MIAPQPPTRVSCDAARSDGLKNSERASVEEGSIASEAARCAAWLPPGWRLRIVAVRQRGTDIAAASARRYRLDLMGRLQAKDLLRPGEEQGNAASQGGDKRRVAAVRLQHNIAAAELSRIERGLGTCGCERHAAQHPPPNATPGFHLPHLTPSTGFAKSRSGVEKPKGTE